MFLTAHVGRVLRCDTDPQQPHQKTQKDAVYISGLLRSGSVQAEQLRITNAASVI